MKQIYFRVWEKGAAACISSRCSINLFMKRHQQRNIWEPHCFTNECKVKGWEKYSLVNGFIMCKNAVISSSLHVPNESISRIQTLKKKAEVKHKIIYQALQPCNHHYSQGVYASVLQKIREHETQYSNPV